MSAPHIPRYNQRMDLETRTTNGARAAEINPGHWKLTIPSGEAGQYRWSQLDDYLTRPRSDFLWEPPLTLSIQARVTQPAHNGTWGFGFWNDPFNTGLGLGGSARRLPALPNAAWFFYASPPNHLALHPHPAQGFLAATFRSPRIPAPFLTPGLLLAPLLLNRHTSGWVRSLAGFFVTDRAVNINVDVTNWQTYQLVWRKERVEFFVNDLQIFSTAAAPKGKLGFVLWIDNQYAAFPPQGKLSFGTVPTEQESSLEIKSLSISKTS